MFIVYGRLRQEHNKESINCISRVFSNEKLDFIGDLLDFYMLFVLIILKTNIQLTCLIHFKKTAIYYAFNLITKPNFNIV